MVYIFDTSSFSPILEYYYPCAFPTFWRKFNADIANGAIISVREVQYELENWGNSLIDYAWIRRNTKIFTTPTTADQQYVDKLLVSPDGAGLRKPDEETTAPPPLADTWLIAKAHSLPGSGVVVTEETRNPKSTNRIGSRSKIPDVCDNRGIPCINLAQFMIIEDWRF